MTAFCQRNGNDHPRLVIASPPMTTHAQLTSVQSRWQFWIDRGGTFTDIVACRPDGALVSATSPSGVAVTMGDIDEVDAAIGSMPA